jgi:RNA polymerase sigma-70 factor (ECF subfamily)
MSRKHPKPSRGQFAVYQREVVGEAIFCQPSRPHLRLHARMTTVFMERTTDDLQDFDQVVQRHRQAVFRFILASLRDRDDAETLTQECFLKAFRGRDQFRGEAAVKTWLMQIAANLVRDLTRTRRFQFWRRARTNAPGIHELSDFLVSREISPEAEALAQERVQAIWTATERLPQRQREVFLLRFVEDMNLLEIADVLGMAEGTVKKHLFRALEKVRQHVRGLK